MFLEKRRFEKRHPYDRTKAGDRPSAPDRDPASAALDSVALSSQIGEQDTMADKLRLMFVQNRLALISAVVIVLFVAAAIAAPVLTPYDPKQMDMMNRLAPPSPAHLLGTDEGGRDILARMLYGSRVSLLAGVVPTLMSMAAGALLGVLSGFSSAEADDLIMRIADIMLAFPSTLLAMLIMYTLGGGLINVFLTLSLVGWAGIARVVRAETLRLRSSMYVTAARSIGVSRARIILRHILPNCMPTLIVLFTLTVPSSILTESSLSFLGLGIQPPDTSWGQMINAGRQYLYNAPWLCFAPCAAIMLIVLAFNFLGDGLRDVLDPHLEKE